MRAVAVANRHGRLSLDRRAVARAVHVLDCAAKDLGGACPPGELSIVFMSDSELAKLHGEFLGDPAVTDVITFEGDPSVETAGEICISADAALRQGGKKAFSRELTLYLAHGWLHLAGFDDLEPKAKRIMRRAESKAMTALKSSERMPEFSLKTGR